MGSGRFRGSALTPLVAVLGLAASVVTTGATWQAAQRSADAERRAQATVLRERLDGALDDAGARLDDLAVAVDAARDAEHGGFYPLGSRIVLETSLASLGYLRHVPARGVEAFEDARGVAIEERLPDGTPAPARPRRVHYPSVSAVGTHAGLFDAAADPAARNPPLRAALVEARESGGARTTAPLRMPGALGVALGFVAPAGTRGYIAGFLPVATLEERLASETPDARFTLRPGPGEGGLSLTVARPAPAAGRTLAVAIIALLATLAIGLASRLLARRERQAQADRIAAEERSRRLAETSTDVLVVHDARGRLTYLSPACRELLGREPESLLGRSPRELAHPEDLHRWSAALAEIAAGADRLTATVRLARADGTWVWTEVRMRVLRDAHGAVAESHATVRDITERMNAQTALEAAEVRFRSTFERAPIGMAITGVDGRFMRVNDALAALIGRPRDELEGTRVRSVTHRADVDADADAMARLVAGEIDVYTTEKRYLHADGSPVWAALQSCVVRSPDGTPLHFLSQMQDITERRRHEEELRHLADHDPLTGLLNRRSFERELERHVAQVERYGARGAAIVLDLDHFKTINDTLGHGIGDELIVHVAHALRGRLRDSDVLARLGGDEFAVLLPEGGRAEAEAVAASVLDAVRSQAVLARSGHARHVTASLGVALFTQHRHLTPDAMLVEADLAMYEAKDAGRDRYAIADGTTTDSRVGGRLSWADQIRDALDEDRFVLHAQPIVDLATGRTGQYELLLRMVDPAGELIAPGAFLPVAERYDLIGQIDRWVVRRAIAMLAEAVAAGHPITVEVNLSGGSTGDPQLLALIEGELRETEVDPARLIFEITETTAVANIPAAQHFAARLAELGCRFALDDFGAGFGSFYYLKHLPFDYLKIDGEFVRRCADDRTDQLVIEAVVGIARGMGKRTIAEQAGDDATLALLARMGVDQAQGFFLGRPAPLEEWLAKAGTERAGV